MTATPYPPAPPRKPPPSLWWFALPGVLFVGALATFIVLLIATVSNAHETEGWAAVDGREHVVTLGSQDTHTVLVDQRAANPNCSVTESDGTPIELRPFGASFTRSSGDGDFRAAWNFDNATGEVLIRCQPAGPGPTTRVMIGPEIELGAFVGGIFATVLIPMALGTFGLLALIILIVVRVTRTRPAGSPTYNR